MAEDAGAKRRRLIRADSATSQGESGDASVMLSASGRVTDPDDIVSGLLLPKLAEENLAGFQAILPAQSAGPLGHRPGCLKLTWGSCCSGSEGLHYVVEAVNEVLHGKVAMEHKFSCEIDQKKRAWVKNVLENGSLFPEKDSAPQALPGNGCIFQDIQKMDQKFARCDRHNKDCPVSTVDVLLLGTSCKDLSRANSSVDRSRLVLAQGTSRGGSAQTYKGFVQYVRTYKPLVIVYENVDAIDDKISHAQETNLSLMMRELKELGYEGQKVMTDAQEFGLPCRRRRLYVFFILAGSNRFVWGGQAIGQVFANFRKLVSSCLRSAPCATKCLLQPDKHQAHLTQALKEHTSSAEKAAAAANKKNPLALAAGQTWVTKHMEYAESLGVRWATQVPQELLDNAWYGTLTKREGDALQLSRVAAPHTEFRNLSQSIGRVHGQTLQQNGKHVAPTMLPQQLLWTESQARLVTGVEALIMQGFPILLLLDNMKATGQETQVSGAFLHDLAGNAMALPVALAILQSGLASIQLTLDEMSSDRSHRSEALEEEDHDVRIAMAALKRLG